jgi:hypothetical protein
MPQFKALPAIFSPKQGFARPESLDLLFFAF